MPRALLTLRAANDGRATTLNGGNAFDVYANYHNDGRSLLAFNAGEVRIGTSEAVNLTDAAPHYPVVAAFSWMGALGDSLLCSTCQGTLTVPRSLARNASGPPRG